MNRRRHANTVPVAALVRWVVAAFFLCTAGLCYVYFKNQMQTTGDEIRNLEGELAALRTEDDTERAQIDRLSSHSYLQRRLAEGFIQLTPITDDRIVRIHRGRPRAGGARPASADGTRRTAACLQPDRCPMNRSAKVRALIACCALALCFTGFSARLVHLQVTMHESTRRWPRRSTSTSRSSTRGAG